MTADPVHRAPRDEFDCGVLIGVLIGEGTFGGDGRQPHVTLRMHVRHEVLFRWLVDRFPRTRLYGPYTHGGRSYFQWMARGPALVHDVLPVLEQRLSPNLDSHAASRLKAMCERYASYIERERRRGSPEADVPSPGRQRIRLGHDLDMGNRPDRDP